MSNSSAHLNPLRTSTSTALWAHLIRKDVGSGSIGVSPANGSMNAPLTPFDKSGTTMRMLLHDTQAHLEKFSSRVDIMTDSVNQSKKEIIAVKTLFEEEHEKLAVYIVDLVNRCQTSVQKSIGRPVQVEQFEELRKDLLLTDRRLEAIDKRMDAIHMLNQTQSQALQSLQDQQSTMLAALMPLLPLLQAIPLHIDAAQNAITQSMVKVSQVASQVAFIPSPKTSTRKRSSSALRSEPLSSPSPLVSSARKKLRLSDAAEPGESSNHNSHRKSQEQINERQCTHLTPQHPVPPQNIPVDSVSRKSLEALPLASLNEHLSPKTTSLFLAPKAKLTPTLPFNLPDRSDNADMTSFFEQPGASVSSNMIPPSRRPQKLLRTQTPNMDALVAPSITLLPKSNQVISSKNSNTAIEDAMSPKNGFNNQEITLRTCASALFIQNSCPRPQRRNTNLSWTRTLHDVSPSKPTGYTPSTYRNPANNLQITPIARPRSASPARIPNDRNNGDNGTEQGIQVDWPHLRPSARSADITVSHLVSVSPRVPTNQMKPPSLKDRLIRIEGKRFIPLLDEDDDDDSLELALG